MIEWLRRRFQRRAASTETCHEMVCEHAHEETVDEEKERLRREMHDARARLHVLEWQADVMRRKRREGP